VSSHSRRHFIQAVAVALASRSIAVANPATILRFPHVQNVRRDGATVRWTSRERTTSVLELSADGETTRVAAAVREFTRAQTNMSQSYFEYEARLRKLKSGTEYTYRVFADDQLLTADALRFRTPGAQPVKFVSFGDSGMGTPEQQQLVGRMMSHSAKLVVHTGDLVYPTGTYEGYEKFYFDFYRQMMTEVPFFPCPGNHDYYEFRCGPYREVHSLPNEGIPPAESGRYYSYDWGNVHFISLDSNDSLIDAVEGRGKMLEWLETDLQRTDKFWRVVYLHHPAYSAGLHCEELESQLVRQYIVPILDKYSVPLVLNGHEHSYQRSYPMSQGQVAARGDGTVYITTGGGGATLHPVFSSPFVEIAQSRHHYIVCDINGAAGQIRAFGLAGDIFDTATLTPQPVLVPHGIVNSASFTPSVAPGGLVTIFGWQLSPEDIVPPKFPLPKSAAGLSVLLNDEQLPILMASAKQVNVQLPFTAPGDATLTVKTPNGKVSTMIKIASVAPALFADAVFHESGMQVTADVPAKVGELVSIYLTGLGAVYGDAAAGVPASELQAATIVHVRLGGRVLPVEFAGLAAGLAGVNVVRFRVPIATGTATGLSVRAAGAESNEVLLHVANS
jgi:acid phosphatase type 7